MLKGNLNIFHNIENIAAYKSQSTRNHYDLSYLRQPSKAILCNK
jgi:hypothetical protein